MAWTAPSTWVAGAILTAAQLNTQLRDNMLCGGPIYATEALRNADIPSPFEGQRAYITGSTVAAATGGVTNVPSGIQTVYNGSAWVCTTPVSAYTTNIGTTTSTTYTATLSGSPGTNPSVTLSTGTTALISFAMLGNTTANLLLASVAVSGAGTVAASDSYRVQTYLPTDTSLSWSVVISGLTAGTNTFTLQYRNNVGGTVTVANRSLTVQGVA
jgi:hypothetical protein